MPNRENSARISHVLGNYEIFDELGRGGMGIVYRGLDLSLDRPVAVKVLRDDLRMQPMIVSRFAREARAAASLDHPNIVQIYSVGEANRTPYIAMELIDSEPLSSLMIQEGKLPWERAFAIAEQVAAALGSAHDAQIIHRDVKPPNILLTAQDKAYVTDFGIAKILSMHDQLTLDGTKLGTPQYMSPERCKTGDASASSDLYSLGVLLFQMISGRLPHEGASATELIRRILSQPPARLRAFVPELPEDVERLVAWLIEAKPEDRPASALVALDAMRRVRAGERLDVQSSAVSRAIADFRGDGRTSRRGKTERKRPKTTSPSRPISVRDRWFALAAAALVSIALGWGLGTRFQSNDVEAVAGQHEISNWYVSKNAASFLREAENIWIAHLSNLGQQIQHVTWSEADRSFLLLANSGGGEEAQVVLSVNPAVLFANVGVPRPIGDSAFVEYESGDVTRAGFIGFDSGMTTALGTQWTSGLIADAVDGSGEVVQCAFHPSDSRLLFVVREPSGQEILFEYGVGDVSVPKMAAESIEMIGYTVSGSQYFFTVGDAEGSTQAYRGDTGSNANPLSVWQGTNSVTVGGLHPEGLSIVVDGGNDDLVEIAFDGPAGERWIGSGSDPTWIDSERLVLIAKDTRGMTQIWVLSIDYPADRRQITFLEGGVEGPITVSSGGQWIAAMPRSGGRSALMLLEIGDRVSGEQE